MLGNYIFNGHYCCPPEQRSIGARSEIYVLGRYWRPKLSKFEGPENNANLGTSLFKIDAFHHGNRK